MVVTQRNLVGVVVAVLAVAFAAGAHAGPPKATTFKEPNEVWWGHKNRSFGNYMEVEKANIPPKPAPKVKKDIPPGTELGVILFDLDKADLRPDGIKIAKKVLKFMKDHPAKYVMVEGHCCDLASEAYNMALGRRRAESVKRFLVDNGIDANRIQTATFGEERRVADDPDQRHLNRRAVVVVSCVDEAK
jgi:outer membrane protein OmpA-like peptidoglycan-associated protein